MGDLTYGGLDGACKIYVGDLGRLDADLQGRKISRDAYEERVGVCSGNFVNRSLVDEAGAYPLDMQRQVAKEKVAALLRSEGLVRTTEGSFGRGTVVDCIDDAECEPVVIDSDTTLTPAEMKTCDW
jgi:hypothetical protein